RRRSSGSCAAIARNGSGGTGRCDRSPCRRSRHKVKCDWMLPVSILGTRVLRAAEDPRFLTGGDRYIDNIDVDGAAHVVFVYSTVAHARIAAIDTADARSMPGVLGVYTAADVGLPPKRVDMARVPEV